MGAIGWPSNRPDPTTTKMEVGIKRTCAFREPPSWHVRGRSRALPHRVQRTADTPVPRKSVLRLRMRGYGGVERAVSRLPGASPAAARPARSRPVLPPCDALCFVEAIRLVRCQLYGRQRPRLWQARRSGQSAGRHDGVKRLSCRENDHRTRAPLPMNGHQANAVTAFFENPGPRPRRARPVVKLFDETAKRDAAVQLCTTGQLGECSTPRAPAHRPIGRKPRARASSKLVDGVGVGR